MVPKLILLFTREGWSAQPYSINFGFDLFFSTLDQLNFNFDVCVPGHATGPSSNYRPPFLDHFDSSNKAEKPGSDKPAADQPPVASAPPAPATSSDEQAAYKRQFDQVSWSPNTDLHSTSTIPFHNFSCNRELKEMMASMLISPSAFKT